MVEDVEDGEEGSVLEAVEEGEEGVAEVGVGEGEGEGRRGRGKENEQERHSSAAFIAQVNFHEIAESINIELQTNYDN